MRGALLLVLALGCSKDHGRRPTATGSTSGAPTGTVPGLPSGLPTGSTPTGCPLPTRAAGRGGDASADAATVSAWFVEIEAGGLSDDDTTSGMAWVDLDSDGDPDAVISRGNRLQFYRNDGCFQLTESALDANGATGQGLTGAMAVDLDKDGFLDLYLASKGEADRSVLLMSDGRWDKFVDRAVEYGVDNPGGYVRAGASMADIDGDGWWDMALGGHQIGSNTALGRPLSRLLMFRPGASGWSDGQFEDIGGTAAAPGFGGIEAEPCTPGSEATGLDATLVDLDGDGALDLLWATHIDMFYTKHDESCITADNPYGFRVWKGDGAGNFTEQAEGSQPFVELGSVAWSDVEGRYLEGALGPALGPETMTLFDPDNDGDRDLLLVGPTDPEWAISTEMTTYAGPGTVARFFRNDGGTWTEATTDVGLDALSWTVGDWGSFFDHPVMATSPVNDQLCEVGPHDPWCAAFTPAERQPYPAQVLPLDADNDGWVDLLYVNRQCDYDGQPDDDYRSMLFRNRGDGTYEPMVTELSGVVGCGLAGFAVDVDTDGWVDLHLIARDDIQNKDDWRDRVLWNAGRTRSHADRHWLELSLDGRPETELLHARMVAKDSRGATVATGWVERETWRGSVDPVVHLGLGAVDQVTVEVTLRDGTRQSFTPDADQRAVLTLR